MTPDNQLDPPLRRFIALSVLLCLTGSLAACAAGNETIHNSDKSIETTDNTSRESYDEFRAQLDEILAVTGEPAGWTTEFDQPWGSDLDIILVPRACDTENWEDSPQRLQLTVIGPGTEDPQTDRAAMVQYMEDKGLTISGLFGDPSYPDGVSWDASGLGENGLEITYGTSSQSRVVSLYGECSGHPSMQEKVSRDTP